MTNQHRIGIILGTRPEAIKLSPVIQAFRRSPDFELQVILTGQHREMVEQVMKLFKLKPDWNLEIMQRQQSLSD
ncbi:MAG: UDP-N-acetylglucosamine 2-epimerase, partial [Cyanobacteriota bacterium]